MSSVTRFIRQIPASASHLNAATVVANSATMVFELVPSASNVVGNYPPGYMQTASAALQAAITAAGASVVLRDMGKTILAPIGSASGNQGFFRQVQLLAPGAVSASQGFNGGSAGSTFGVLGAANVPDAYTDYLTFYIPVHVAGVNSGPVNINAFPIAGGQM
jgi:hypothetical protein